MNDLYHRAYTLGNALAQRGLTVCTVESCTGGGIAYALTEVPGSSQWFGYGWVTYSNQAKQELVGVSAEIINQHGAVSESVVSAMARNGLARAQADICMAVSGIAGPGGGTADKPVGTVWIAWASKTFLHTTCLALQGDRESIRQQAIMHALQECERLVLAEMGV